MPLGQVGPLKVDDLDVSPIMATTEGWCLNLFIVGVLRAKPSTGDTPYSMKLYVQNFIQLYALNVIPLVGRRHR